MISNEVQVQAVLRRAGCVDDGQPVRLSGGDTSQVWRQGSFVVKQGAVHPEQFPAEAHGLRTLRQAGIPSPEVLFVDESSLVMPYLEPGLSRPEALAEVIARLHGVRGDRYGSDDAVFLGRFRLSGGWGEADWVNFWVEQRVGPLLQASWSKLAGLGPRLERLLSEYRPPSEGPVLLHGDLWSGNVYASSEGPMLIDPSVWWGERGVDLAMMALFGGFGGACRQRYQELSPVPREVEESLAYYQVYYLLLHVLYFGSSYLRQIEQVVSEYGR